MTWEEILERDDIVGGDIESQEDGIIFRGPIESIKIKDGIVIIKSKWLARLDPRESDGWKKSDTTELSVSANSKPEKIPGNRIYFQFPPPGQCIIFPKGDSKLDPKLVKDLTPEQY
jgi:hypothetical protein